MKEVVFISRNNKRWKEFEEKLVNVQNVDPETLSRLYIQITDDLSYARTYYPGTDITLYLNNLAVKAHHLIYKNKKIDRKGFFEFWKRTYPVIVKESHRYILYALIIIIVSTAIGWISSQHDRGFVRLILGDRYVNMTLENIKNNDPLAVYKDANRVNMFLGITFNNIYVSFMAYIFGILFSVGSGYILFKNGIMMGAFLHLFYEYGLLRNCLLTIFIHGTLELFAITVAGAAGIMMGNSILFPGTYSRMISFRKGVNRSIKLLVGLVPLFMVAGFLEGFVTRYSAMPDSIKLSVILISGAFIIFYFLYYPLKITKTLNHGRSYNLTETP